jgi:hypothetical protein
MPKVKRLENFLSYIMLTKNFNIPAAAALDTIFVLSTFSNWSIEDVAKEAPGGRKWFQLFPNSDKYI